MMGAFTGHMTPSEGGWKVIPVQDAMHPQAASYAITQKGGNNNPPDPSAGVG